MTEYKQFVFNVAGKWNSTCSCGRKLLFDSQVLAMQDKDFHAKSHEAVPESTIVEARTQFFETYNDLNHVGTGMKDRLNRFKAAWANLKQLTNRK